MARLARGGTAKCDTGSGGSCTSNDPCPLTGFYTTGNPPINYTNISYQDCLANDVPAGDEADGMSTFNSALARGDVADFNMVIPNGCEDGEANCKPLNNKHLQFDTFLRARDPAHRSIAGVRTERSDRRHVRRGPANGRACGEERSGSGGHTICFVLSPLAVQGDYGAKTYSYSLLRTLQDGLGLSPYLGDAASVAPLPLTWR